LSATAGSVKSSAAATLALAGVFVALALLLHRPGFGGPFISDDLLYLEHNEALSLPLGDAIRRVTLDRYYVVGNWSPVHQLFLLAEWRAFGTNPLPYRMANALLHALAALAMIAAGRRIGLSRPAALAAGTLFLVHPVAAEPVGWINQSKTLLSVGFSLCALERWLAWLDQPSSGRVVAATLLGALAVLAKPAAIPLPAIFLLALWTHGRQDTRRRAAFELIPLTTIGVIAFALGLVAQAEQGGVSPWFGGGPLATAQILPWITWRYVRLVFAPFDLVHGVHPAAVTGWSDERLLWPAAALVAVALLVVRACWLRRKRWLAAAWFFGMLLPVIQVIPMSNVFADRYLYAALPGALWLIADLVDTTARRRGPGAQHAVFGVFAIVVVLFAGFSHGRARKWADPESLYREATIAYPLGRTGWTGLGAEAQKQHDLSGAARSYLQSLAISHDDDAHVRHLLGRVRLEAQRPDLALYDLETSLRLAPTHPNALWTRRMIDKLRAQGVQPAPDEPSRPVP
jgi:hypothetical protein